MATTSYVDFRMTEDGDLDLSSQDLSLVTDNKTSLKQRLMMRFNVWEGNWDFDTDLGFPYRKYIGNKVTKSILDAEIKKEVRQEPDVIGISNFTSMYDSAGRHYTAYFDVVTIENEELSLAFVGSDDFIYPIGTGGPEASCGQKFTVLYSNKFYELINFRLPAGGNLTWINSSVN